MCSRHLTFLRMWFVDVLLLWPRLVRLVPPGCCPLLSLVWHLCQPSCSLQIIGPFSALLCGVCHPRAPLLSLSFPDRIRLLAELMVWRVLLSKSRESVACKIWGRFYVPVCPLPPCGAVSSDPVCGLHTFSKAPATGGYIQCSGAREGTASQLARQ